MSKINVSLNDVFKSTPMGDLRSAIGTTFYGINHRQTPNPVPINQDGYGLVFFTRPQLNLTADNIRSDRTFIPLLSTLDTSIQRIIRCYLDPRLMLTPGPGMAAPFVDNQNPFIPLMTNHLLTATGWPDPVQDTFTSKPGAYKEVFGFTDSTLEINGAYDITATWRNMVGDPLSLLIHSWMKYKSNVFTGIFMPYPDFLVKNEIDYNTAIWRIVLDKNKRIVQKIAKTGAAEPVTINLGSSFNFDHEKPLNETNDRVEVQFRCYGAKYNDPILIHEFNKIVGVFNPSMRPPAGGILPRPSMMPVPMASLDFFNGRGYPFINPNTMELLWYVPTEEYSQVMRAFEDHNAALNLEYTDATNTVVSHSQIEKP